jgi:cytochrome c oxidase subunit 4
MNNNKINHSDDHSPGYGMNVLIWMSLLGLTALTVAIAGIDLGSYTLLVAMIIAAIKSILVINVFMHIKFDDSIFKVFLLVTLIILAVVFALTAFDVFYR